MSPLDLLQQLIAIPSVNPMGRPLAGPEYLEGRVSDFLMDFFARLDLPHERIEVVPGRHNVLAFLAGTVGAPLVMLDAHQDTVPVDGMSIDPFTPVVQGGRVYGRGACDVKGGLAAMLAAVERLARERPPRHAHVLMACTCDEEKGRLGATDLVRRYTGAIQPPCRLLPTPPDMIVVAEPTQLQIVVAHRGATRWTIRTRGRAAHSSDPGQGINAVYRMARLVQALEGYADQLPRDSTAHPLCGAPTLSVGRIEGGTSINIVPAECSIDIDRRVVPGEDGNRVMAAVEDYLRERLDFDFEMLPAWSISPALADDGNGALADLLQAAARDILGRCDRVGAAYGTHASTYAASGVPSVVFGPGSVEQAHTKDEWLEIDQLDHAADVIANFLCRL